MVLGCDGSLRQGPGDDARIEPGAEAGPRSCLRSRTVDALLETRGISHCIRASSSDHAARWNSASLGAEAERRSEDFGSAYNGKLREIEFSPHRVGMPAADRAQ